ncbi:SLAIN motif-containing protein-like isoform X1 [Entelurus aequoreus]|uniref:SLAIN motif-containing protein-like isoform X1 n=1 Tax=Entelurus aequoreus TaxID=161455 RepID=UPI002B1D0175|nr:SLAIN motif-containing protein-like isoform X1 [Entelurus aequoreus]
MEVQDLVRHDWDVDFYDDTSLNCPVSEQLANVWDKPTVVKCKSSRSFAKDARMRLDYLKFGSQVPRGVKEGAMHHGESEKNHTVLDLVELLDIKDEVEDEESWLYESPETATSVSSPLRWCRHVLDNPTPETEAACRLLTNELNQSSSRSVLYRQPAVQPQRDTYTYVNTVRNTSDSSENNDVSMTHQAISSNYKLEDITDVHIMARIQEDSLRQDQVSAGSSSEPQVTLRQQVAQFKLLKRAQNGARTQSPLRTSLRSLQAVRNSRSLDMDDYLPAHQASNTFLPSAVSSSRMERHCGPSSMNANDSSSHLEKSCSVQKMAVREVQRSQSLSPCRLPHSAKRYLSFTSCVHASPDRITSTAWGSKMSSTPR